MSLVAFLIAITISTTADYDSYVNDLRATARQYGCDRPVIERYADPNKPYVRLMLTCREVSPDGRDN